MGKGLSKLGQVSGNLTHDLQYIKEDENAKLYHFSLGIIFLRFSFISWEDLDLGLHVLVHVHVLYMRGNNELCKGS